VRFPLAVIRGGDGTCHRSKMHAAEAVVTGISATRPADRHWRPQLHLYCPGRGNPTVILGASLGAFSIDWSLVQPNVAENPRVCSCDRAGLGWTAPGPPDETVEQTIVDLDALLRAAEKRGHTCWLERQSQESTFKATSGCIQRM
jgi:pimeloyl-ACP methyl ester carboxylesterase